MDTATPAVQNDLELRPSPGVWLRQVPEGVQLRLVDGHERFVRTVVDPAAGHELELVPRPDAQGAFPDTGVLPGAAWRRRDPLEENDPGRPELEAEQLSWAWFRVERKRLRGDAWTDDDDHTLAEVALRCWNHVDVGQRFSLPRPGWFVGLVPRVLWALVSLVWDAYQAGAFGVQMTTAQVGAELGVTDRTVRRWRWFAQRLGMVRAIAGRVEKTDGPGWEQSVTTYRLGAALELLAGLCAFERGKVPRRKGISRKRARQRGAALRRAARVVKREREGELWRAMPRNAGRVRRASSSAPRRRPQSAAPADRHVSPSPGRRQRLRRPESADAALLAALLGESVVPEEPPPVHAPPKVGRTFNPPTPLPPFHGVGGRLGESRGKPPRPPSNELAPLAPPATRPTRPRRPTPAAANVAASPETAKRAGPLGRRFEGGGAAPSSRPTPEPERGAGSVATDAAAELARALAKLGDSSPFRQSLGDWLELTPAEQRVYDRCDDAGRGRLRAARAHQRAAERSLEPDPVDELELELERATVATPSAGDRPGEE